MGTTSEATKLGSSIPVRLKPKRIEIKNKDIVSKLGYITAIPRIRTIYCELFNRPRKLDESSNARGMDSSAVDRNGVDNSTGTGISR